jgi:hypothetical protein
MGRTWATRRHPGDPIVRKGLFDGLVFGSAMLVVGLDDDKPPAATIVVAVLAGLLFGLWGAWSKGRKWPAGRALSSRDRAEVARLVAHGEAPRDTGLAPAALELAQIHRKAASRRPSDRWLPIAFLFLAVGWGAFEVAGGSVVVAVYLWILAVVLAVAVIRVPALVAKRESSAERSEFATRAWLNAIAVRGVHP